MDSVLVYEMDTLSFLGKSLLGFSEAHEHASIWNDWASSFYILIAFIVFLSILLLCYPIKKWIIGHLKVLALVIWGIGVGLYRVGFDDGGCADNMLALYLRASLSAMEMFVSHSDLIEVHQHWHHSGLYMTIFSTVHFCAVLISAVFILRLFGLNFLSWLKLIYWNMTLIFRKKNSLAVFWGVNRNALNMAKSLHHIPGKKIRILFVNLPDNDHQHEASRFTFSHFFHTANAGIDKYVEEIEEMGAVLLSAGKQFRWSGINCQESRQLFRDLKVSRLCDTLIDRTLKCYAKVDFYFLSEQEQDNLSAIMALKQICGQSESSLYNQNQLFSCYCHARRNNVNFALINSEGLRHQVHFIDSSSLSVWQLKKTAACHPVNFVKVIPETGTVSSSFTAMVIGFGETGRDAFGFLYEFGSFVAQVSPGDDGIDRIIAQKKKIYVVDPNLKTLRAEYLSDRPGLRNDGSVEWWNTLTEEDSFSGRLEKIINELNCVAITVGDDETAILLAAKICHVAIRYRTVSEKLALFVRIRHKEQKAKMMAVKDYFDRYNPEGHLFVYLFGCNEEIFSYNTLRRDILETRAMSFFYRYSQETAELWLEGEKLRSEQERLSKSSPHKEWMKRRKEKNSSVKEHYTVFYQEEQDRSNAWHILTKRKLAGLEDGDEVRRHECLSDAHLIRTIGYGEHLRWNAKMYLMGFEYGDQKMIERKQHPCLVDCDQLVRNKLQRDTLRYDEAVVRLSMSKEFDNMK